MSNEDFVAHSEPICKKLQLLKVTDMFRLAIWKLYYKLMNNTLPPNCIVVKPILPQICEFHVIRKPLYHLPNIKHQFAEQLIKYHLVKLLNNTHGSTLITAKVQTHSFQGVKLYIRPGFWLHILNQL